MTSTELIFDWTVFTVFVPHPYFTVTRFSLSPLFHPHPCPYFTLTSISTRLVFHHRPYFTVASISTWPLFHPHPFLLALMRVKPIFNPRPYFTFTLVSPFFQFHPLILSIVTKLVATRSKFIFRLICWILKSVRRLTPPTHSKDIAMTSAALPVEIREQVSSQSSPSNPFDQYGTDRSHNLIVILRHPAEVWEMKY